MKKMIFIALALASASIAMADSEAYSIQNNSSDTVRVFTDISNPHQSTAKEIPPGGYWWGYALGSGVFIKIEGHTKVAALYSVPTKIGEQYCSTIYDDSGLAISLQDANTLGNTGSNFICARTDKIMAADFTGIVSSNYTLSMKAKETMWQPNTKNMMTTEKDVSL